MRRAWLWLGAAVVGLVVAVGLALSLPYTQVGSRWLLAGAAGFLPESLTYESFEGTLAGPFEVRGLEYSFGRLSGRLEVARVYWQPWKLAGKTMQLDSVNVTGAWLKWDTAHVVQDRDSTPEDTGGTPGWKVLCDQLNVSGGVLEGPYGVTLHKVQLTSGGGLDSFHVSLNSLVSHDSLPEFALALTGHGDLEHLELGDLLLTRDSSRLALQGRVEWKPAVAWDVVAQGHALDPSMWSRHLDRLHGDLWMTGSSRGKYDAGKLEFALVVDTLSGVLQDSPIAGYVSLQVQDDAIRTDSTWIEWRGLSARVQGQYEDTAQLVWELEAPDLSLLSEKCKGSIQAHGEAHGSREALEVSAELSGAHLVYGEYTADTAEIDLEWLRGGAQPSKLNARLGRVTFSTFEFDTVSLTAEGTRAAHKAHVALAGANGSLYAAVAGGYDSLWQGSLDTLAVMGNRSGPWRLTEPAGIKAGPGRAVVPHICFEGDNGRLCAAVEMRSGGDWEGNVELQSVALDWLSRLLSADVVVDSRLSGSVHVNYAARNGFSAEAQLSMERGPVSLSALPEDTVTADSLALNFECTPEEGRLHAGGGFTLRGEHTPFALECVLPGTRLLKSELAEDSIHWSRLPWSIALDIDPLALSWLNPLLPEDSHLDGEASLHVEASPVADGRILGDCALNFPPGHMRVWTGTDTLVLDWATTVLELRADSTGTHVQAHSGLSTAARSVGTLDLQLNSPQSPAWGQNPLDLPLSGSADARIDLAPLEYFVPGVSGLKGEFIVQSTLQGTPRDLALEGSLELTAEALIQDLGIQLSGVRLSMRAAGGSTTVSGSATSNGGTVELSGSLSRLPSREAPSRLQLKGDAFQVLDSRQASVWISPDLELAMVGDSLELSGSVIIPQARIEIVKLPEQAVAASPDAVILGDTLESRSPRLPFWSRVQVTLGDQVFFKGFDVSTFLDGSLEIRQRPGTEAEGRGEVVLREGRYRGMGQDLQIDPGRLIFSGSLFDPAIDVLAYRRATDHTKAGFKVSGRLTSPQVDLFSDPMKPEQDIMSYILFGRSSGTGSESERLKASEAAAYLGGNLLAGQAATQIGLDEARIDPGYTGTDAALVAGKYLSPQLFVGYGTGLFETLHTLRVRYIVSTHISLQAETGTRETADVIYQIERGD